MKSVLHFVHVPPHRKEEGKSQKKETVQRMILFILLPSTFLLSSCACPRRKAESSHVIESFANRPDGLLRRETWRDTEGGGGLFFCADPNVQNMFAAHTNQSTLGGGSVFSAGTVTITVDTNTAAVLGSAGTARRQRHRRRRQSCNQIRNKK